MQNQNHVVKGKMDITCKLCTKCLKVDENLEKCHDPN